MLRCLDDKKVRLAIDTGAEYNFSEDRTFLDSLKPIRSLDGPLTNSAGGKDARIEATSTKLLRLHKLAVGEVTIDNPVFQQFPHQIEHKFSALGLDFLSRFRVLLDFPAKQMYLTPDPAYREDPLEYVGTGAEISSRNGQLLVTRVLSPSPAEKAGLRAGDEVIAWGKLKAKDVTALTLKQLVQAQERNRADCHDQASGRTETVYRDAKSPKVALIAVLTPCYRSFLTIEGGDTALSTVLLPGSRLAYLGLEASLNRSQR